MDAKIPSRTDGKSFRKLTDAYEQYLLEGKRESSPREAHMFALAMRHKGETFDRSVEELVVELAGVLPAYWTDPFGVDSA